MPKSKDPNSYPPEYRALLDAVRPGKPFTFVTERKQATYFRHDFHAYIKALQVSGNVQEATKGKRLIIQFDPSQGAPTDTVTVSVRSRSGTPLTAQIREVLEAEGVEIPEDQPQAVYEDDMFSNLLGDHNDDGGS